MRDAQIPGRFIAIKSERGEQGAKLDMDHPSVGVPPRGKVKDETHKRWCVRLSSKNRTITHRHESQHLFRGCTIFCTVPCAVRMMACYTDTVTCVSSMLSIKHCAVLSSGFDTSSARLSFNMHRDECKQSRLKTYARKLGHRKTTRLSVTETLISN